MVVKLNEHDSFEHESITSGSKNVQERNIVQDNIVQEKNIVYRHKYEISKISSMPALVHYDDDENTKRILATAAAE